MHESQLLRDLLIHIFPQLTPDDFPAIDIEQNSATWFETWLEEFSVAQDYILDCHYQEWANAFDMKLNFLAINHTKPIAIDATLDEVYSFFEELEEQQQLDAEEMGEDEDDEPPYELPESFYFEQQDGILEMTIVIVENLLNTILRHGINVIAILHPQQFQFILSHGKTQPLQDLNHVLQATYSPARVRLFLSEDYSHHQFAHLIGKLL